MDLLKGYKSGSSSAMSSQAFSQGIETNNLNNINESDISFSIEDPEVNHNELQIEDNVSNETEFDPSMTNQSNVKNETKRKTRQLKRNTGQLYVNSTGKTVQPRCMKRLGYCRQDCRTKISYEDQSRIFSMYWAEGSYEKRFNFVASSITLIEKQRVRGKLNIRVRRYTVQYYLTKETHQVSVCRKCFLNTLDETESFVKNVASKSWIKMNKAIASDKRGKSAPKNKSCPYKIKKIEEHIAKFPAYFSHYGRSHTSKKYLPAGLNIKTMHQLYLNEVKEESLSLKIYRTVFAKTGIRFKSPQIDTCHKCDRIAAKLKYQTDQAVVEQLIIERDTHHQNAKLAYSAKKADKERAKKSNGTIVFNSFDLQQCLPTPLLETSVAFYKRPLWVFNLTVNSSDTNTKCYMWHEAIAKRGGNEIASCIYSNLKSLHPAVEHVIYYSDNCPGQNKNKIVSGMYSAYCGNNETLRVIDHKFLESGHTHMECDSDHALIERAKKRHGVSIQHPLDWYDLVRNTRVTEPFKVIEMSQSDFYNFEELYKTNFIMRTSNTDNQKFVWADVKWLRYTKEDQGVVYYKTSLREEDHFMKLNIKKRGKSLFHLDNKLNTCNSKPLPISKEKKKDLLSVLDLLRDDVKLFYTTLADDSNQENVDPDLADLELLDESTDTDLLDRMFQDDNTDPTDNSLNSINQNERNNNIADNENEENINSNQPSCSKQGESRKRLSQKKSLINEEPTLKKPALLIERQTQEQNLSQDCRRSTRSKKEKCANADYVYY